MKRRIEKAAAFTLALVLSATILASMLCCAPSNEELQGGQEGSGAPGAIQWVKKRTPEEVAELADYIIEAEFTAKSDWGGHHALLVFKPKKIIKGVFEGEDAESIRVLPFESIPLASDESDFETDFELGKTYLLCLGRSTSVYYDHNIYYQGDFPLVTPQDKDWAKYRDMLEKTAERTKNNPPDNLDVEFTKSNDLSEVIDFSTNIFVVKVESIFAEQYAIKTASYNCTVLRALKGVPSKYWDAKKDGEIMIKFFTDSVELGGEYVVLLSDDELVKGSYDISSRNLSVFRLDEAEKIPELAALLGMAKQDQG